MTLAALSCSTAVRWRVQFKYERDGFQGEAIVLARAQWRASMAIRKRLHHAGWKRCYLLSPPEPATPADAQVVAYELALARAAESKSKFIIQQPKAEEPTAQTGKPTPCPTHQP